MLYALQLRHQNDSAAVNLRPEIEDNIEQVNFFFLCFLLTLITLTFLPHYYYYPSITHYYYFDYSPHHHYPPSSQCYNYKSTPINNPNTSLTHTPSDNNTLHYAVHVLLTPFLSHGHNLPHAPISSPPLTNISAPRQFG